MKKNISSKFLWIIAIAIVLASCKVKKALVAPPPPPKPIVATNNSRENLFNAINASQVNFNTLSIKAKTALTIDDKSNDVTINMRIEKDKVVWASITVGPIEIARILITPDSLKIINRSENEYIKKPFTYIHAFTSKQVDFKMLQAILIGNTIDSVLTDEATVNNVGDKMSINGLLTDISYLIKYNLLHKVTQTNLKDTDKDKKLVVDYADFGGTESQQLPFFVKLQSETQGKLILAEMKFTNVKFNEALDFPFNVPKRFSVKN